MNTTELRLLFFEEADVLFQIYDEDLNCVDVNSATLKLFNLKREELIGKNIRDLSPESVSSGRYDAYKEVIKTGKTLVINELKVSPDKKEMYFRIKAFKLGKGMGMVTKNITDLEAKIRETVSELQLKVQNLDDANKNILEMMRVVSNQNTQLNDFCGIVSHNLRAPLINLSILSDFIHKAKDETERQLMFSKIKPVVNTLTETFDNLVESLQVREELGVEVHNLNFNDIALKVLEKHKIEIELYHAKIELDFKEAPVIIYSKKYLDSILSNLIGNALKYRSPLRAPSIVVKTQRQAEKIILKVKDNGSGIDLKMHGHHIFKMRKVFHDHPDARGFGLFMTKTQVEAMQGNIFAESAPDKGSTFTIEFNPKNTPYEQN